MADKQKAVRSERPDQKERKKQLAGTKKGKSKKSKSDPVFLLSEWVYDTTDGYHGIITKIDTTGPEPLYHVESLAIGLTMRSRTSAPRVCTADVLDHHAPKEFRYKD